MLLFSSRLKELRKKSKMTQQELGLKINVTKVSICCYENGTRVPSLETLIDLSNVFNVDLDYLVGNDTYVVAEENQEYGIRMAQSEIELVRELRKHVLLYRKLMEDSKRTIEFLDKKIR